jgi:hypothetical protein
MCVRQANKEYREKYPERRKATKERWRKANMASYRRYAAKRRITNKRGVASSIAKWAKKNSARLNANKAKRMADLKHATPKWANLFFMEEIYDLARKKTLATGIKWSVDHIVPMKSDRVCGLHVEHNLRVIPHIHNISKKNRWWPHEAGFDRQLSLC